VEERKARSSSARRRPAFRPPPLEFALRRLARRSHSRGELTDKLTRAGYSEAEIGETLERLASRGYLDDAALARELARSSSERKLWGPARIERRLRELEIEAGEIEAALEEAFPSGEEVAARRALEKFLRASRRGGGERARARAYRHLLARGFSPEVVHRLVSARSFDDTVASQPETESADS
jgi:regulatory protein